MIYESLPVQQIVNAQKRSSVFGSARRSQYLVLRFTRNSVTVRFSSRISAVVTGSFPILFRP